MKKVVLNLLILSSTAFYAREKAGSERVASSGNLGGKVLSNCAAPKSSQELKINNVRTIIYTGGDMWWNLFGDGNARYIVPKTEKLSDGVSSSFAGSIWLGGLDAGGSLKVAAMTYRQNGIDFWPGPLDTTNANISADECLKYDQLYNMTRAEVDGWVNKTGPLTTAITNWPGNGDIFKGQGFYLAPYQDVDGIPGYNPSAGDYPDYDVKNLALKDSRGFCKSKLFGDQTLFWVFNDKGGIHTETQGVPIGVEVRAQAFAFKTNDEINNMTFYNYEIHNRSSFTLNKTYFTIWNDADLGYYLDDYVGCDVSRGLGYIYNADAFDETASGVRGYGDFPPALGCDFFKGPLADPTDAIDNDNDGQLDEDGETIQMSRFTYYNNSIGAFPPQTVNPDIAIHYYNFMTGFWKDGSPFTQGGNGYGGTAPAIYVYDGDPVSNTGWTERGAGNLAGDRRFLQSAGPFTLKPGAVNDITFGMPWAQSPIKGGNLESIKLLLAADDKAQALFDKCFKLLDGPEAPDMLVQELDRELLIYLTNKKGSNNYSVYNNDYVEEDISILSDPSSTVQALANPDKKFRFEGYIVYQVKDANVSSTDLGDVTKAKPVFQCDIKNGISRLINWEIDNNIGDIVPKIKVDGADNGIVTTFKLQDDAFSTSDNKRFVNNKTYYFISVAYAHNNYLTYANNVSPSTNPDANFLGQKRPYLEGRKFKKAAGIPNITDTEKGGTLMQSAFGFGPKITRIEGQGNGGNSLRLTKASEDAIVANNFVPEITYENGSGPINIKVVDPLNVVNSNFTFKFIKNNLKNTTATNTLSLPTGTTTRYLGDLNTDSTSWVLIDEGSGKKYYPNNPDGKIIATPSGTVADYFYQPIKVNNEFFFPEIGLSLSIRQVADPAGEVNKFVDLNTYDESYTGPDAASFLGASIEYANGAGNWFNPVRDDDGGSPTNWIKSGSTKGSSFSFSGLSLDVGADAYYRKIGDGYVFMDPEKRFANILNGTWAPYALTSSIYSITAGATPNTGFARVFGGPGFSSAVWGEAKKSPNLTTEVRDYYGTVSRSVPQLLNCDLRKLSSVLIVLTRDKSKWTRCPVIEMQERAELSEGNAVFFSPRKHASVDKNGNYAASGSGVSTDPNAPNFISETGMGWFPGYAICTETGERLNMMFGEDSYQRTNNGDDMIWNPTSSTSSPFSFAFGGKHFIYVFGANTSKGVFPTDAQFIAAGSASGPPWSLASGPNSLVNTVAGVPRYDNGAYVMDVFKKYYNTTEIFQGAAAMPLNSLERDIMWVSMPLLANGVSFKDPANMPSDVRININVSKPYRYGFSGVSTATSAVVSGLGNALVAGALTTVTNAAQQTTIVSTTPQNNNIPMYKFNTSDIATLFNQADVSKNALDLIRIVPNPYYGSSSYETNRVDNRVRITNLPSKCTVKIFTMNGTLVRTLKRDVTDQEDQLIGNTDIKQTKRSPYMDWDLKNQSNITIASGLYIFHIDAPGIGEKIVKWFGVVRPLDVQNY